DPQGIQAASAFIALLDWVTDTMSRGETSRSWPPHVRLAASWDCAHRLFAIFLSTGMSIERMQSLFAARAALDPRDWLRRSVAFEGDVAYPSQLRPEPLLLDVVVYAAGGGLDARLLPRFLELATRSEGETRHVVPSLMRDPSLGTDGLASFLGGDREGRWG